MTKYTDIMENIINDIEKENPSLKAAEWLQDFENYIQLSLENNVTEEGCLLAFVVSIKFYIVPDYNEFFRDIKTDFNDIYSDIDFDFTIYDGVDYETNPCIVEVLDENNKEQFFDAIKELMPEQLDLVQIQWTFWTIQQKRNFIVTLEKPVARKIQELREKISDSFSDIEAKYKESILEIAKRNISSQFDIC